HFKRWLRSRRSSFWEAHCNWVPWASRSCAVTITFIHRSVCCAPCLRSPQRCLERFPQLLIMRLAMPLIARPIHLMTLLVGYWAGPSLESCFLAQAWVNQGGTSSFSPSGDFFEGESLHRRRLVRLWRTVCHKGVSIPRDQKLFIGWYD